MKFITNLPNRFPVERIDFELKNRLHAWTQAQPLPADGRANLLESAAAPLIRSEYSVKKQRTLKPQQVFNWSATYMIGDRLCNLRLVC